MRKAMLKVVSDLITKDEKSILLMLDIGEWAFHGLKEQYPERVKNIGIFESGTVSIAAGLSLGGLNPIIYGITPFIVQRSLEQIKLDFLYQSLKGNIITTGASYDFSKLGYSHYCAEEVMTLNTLPGIEILTPGTPKEFASLFNKCCQDENLSYFRMSDYCSHTDIEVQFGKANVLKKGSKATIIVVAEMLDTLIEATKDLDITLLYYTTIAPFDYETLSQNIVSNKIIVCEPFYQGSLWNIIVTHMGDRNLKYHSIGIPFEILRSYGTKKEKDDDLGLTIQVIKEKISQLLVK
jgi:transketolase